MSYYKVQNYLFQLNSASFGWRLGLYSRVVFSALHFCQGCMIRQWLPIMFLNVVTNRPSFDSGKTSYPSTPLFQPQDEQCRHQHSALKMLEAFCTMCEIKYPIIMSYYKVQNYLFQLNFASFGWRLGLYSRVVFSALHFCQGCMIRQWLPIMFLNVVTHNPSFDSGNTSYPSAPLFQPQDEQCRHQHSALKMLEAFCTMCEIKYPIIMSYYKVQNYLFQLNSAAFGALACTRGWFLMLSASSKVSSLANNYQQCF